MSYLNEFEYGIVIIIITVEHQYIYHKQCN